MEFVLVLILLICLAVAGAAAQPPDQPLYLDPTQPVETRVKDLVSKMTLEEKASQMFHSAPAIPRLQVPLLSGWNQCLRGVRWSKPTTMFPVPIAQAATWDPELVLQVASAISDEARGIYNLTRDRKDKKGLFYRAPVINISRDPRWGRIEECYGEDPYLTSRIGVSFVKGLQGDDAKYLKLVSTLKHYAVNNQENGRQKLNAEVNERMLMEYWLPHFRACIVEGQAQSIMAMYNALNGVPGAWNKLLLTDILRKQWGFKGFVVSDTGGVEFLVTEHKITSSYEEAAAKAVLAGCDLDDKEYPKYLPDAVRHGLLKESDLDRAVSRIFTDRFRLGEFDPPEMVPYSRISPRVVNSKANRALALRNAQESIVLLQNNDNFLPLDKSKIKTLAVIGPHASAFVTGCAWYTGTCKDPVNPLDGIKNKLGDSVNVVYAQGCSLPGAKEKTTSIDEAALAAKSADAVVLFVGNDSSVENEGFDRKSINLPGKQGDLVKAVYAANPHTVLVMMNAGPVSFRWGKDNLPAILQVWYPGEEGGTAIADVLFGDYNPAGRLPYTVYESLDQIPPQTEYDITKGFTYMYFQGQPLYPFGHGLSYTKFEYTGLKLSRKSIGRTGKLDVTVNVKNTSTRAGDEVVQLYVNDPVCTVQRPSKELRGFRRLTLEPGEEKPVTFTLSADQLAFWDVKTHKFLTQPGEFIVMAGSSSDDIRAKGSFEVK